MSVMCRNRKFLEIKQCILVVIPSYVYSGYTMKYILYNKCAGCTFKLEMYYMVSWCKTVKVDDCFWHWVGLVVDVKTFTLREMGMRYFKIYLIPVLLRLSYFSLSKHTFYGDIINIQLISTTSFNKMMVSFRWFNGGKRL